MFYKQASLLLFFFASIRLSYSHDSDHEVWQACPICWCFFVIFSKLIFFRFHLYASSLFGIGIHCFFIFVFLLVYPSPMNIATEFAYLLRLIQIVVFLFTISIYNEIIDFIFTYLKHICIARIFSNEHGYRICMLAYVNLSRCFSFYNFNL